MALTENLSLNFTTVDGQDLTVSIETIGAHKATQLLETIILNRNVRDEKVHALARAMLTGQWRHDALDPIRIDEDGQLLDGQHRLWAIVESNVDLQFAVVKGIATKTIEVMDTGAPRKLSDLLRIRNEPYPNDLASALTLYGTWRRTGVINRSGGRHYHQTITESLTLLRDHPTLRDSIIEGKKISRILKGGAGRWATVFHILMPINPDDARLFFERIKTGEHLDAMSPIFALRKRVMQDADAHMKMPPREYTALIFKAWNFYRAGKEIRVLSWRPGGATPEKYPIPQ